MQKNYRLSSFHVRDISGQAKPTKWEHLKILLSTYLRLIISAYGFLACVGFIVFTVTKVNFSVMLKNIIFCFISMHLHHCLFAAVFGCELCVAQRGEAAAPQ